MHPTRSGAQLLVDVEEAVDLGTDVVERPRLVAIGGLEGVAVHGITAPHHRPTGGLDGLDDRGKQPTYPSGPHPGDDGEPAGGASRVERLGQGDGLLSSGGGSQLHPQRIVHRTEEGNVGPVQSTGSLPQPHQVPRQVVGQLGALVDTRQGMFVVQQEGLVTRPDTPVTPSVRHELEGCCGGTIHPFQTLGVMLAGSGSELEPVDGVSPVARQLDAVTSLGTPRARFGVLARDPSHGNHGNVGSIGHHRGHRRQDPYLVADVVGTHPCEGLRAVTSLQQEGTSSGDVGQTGTQLVTLPGTNQWRKNTQALHDPTALLGVRVPGLLLHRHGAQTLKGRNRCGHDGSVVT